MLGPAGKEEARPVSLDRASLRVTRLLPNSGTEWGLAWGVADSIKGRSHRSLNQGPLEMVPERPASARVLADVGRRGGEGDRLGLRAGAVLDARVPSRTLPAVPSTSN